MKFLLCLEKKRGWGGKQIGTIFLLESQETAKKEGEKE